MRDSPRVSAAALRSDEVLYPNGIVLIDNFVVVQAMILVITRSHLPAAYHNGTLRLVEDERCLRYEIDPANTSVANDAIELIRRRIFLAVRSCSKSVRAVTPGW